MTRKLAAAAALTVALALTLPGVAGAGGFATVGMKPLPDGTAPGEPWRVELGILQHGVRPMDGLHPRVIVSRGDVERSFAARPTGRPGSYRATVVFPSAGTWRVAVDDDFSQRHAFPPVMVGGEVEETAAAAPVPAESSGSGGGPDLGFALAVAALAGLVATAIAVEVMRRPPAHGGA
jgi:hypothetical protein